MHQNIQLALRFIIVLSGMMLLLLSPVCADGIGVDIEKGTVEISADLITSGESIIVDSDSLIGVLYLALPGAQFFKGGNQGMYFNLDSYDGHTHKSPGPNDKWFLYIDNVEVTEANWSTVTVSSGQTITMRFDDVTAGEQYEYIITTSGDAETYAETSSPAAASDWTVTIINGNLARIVQQHEFETLAKQYARSGETDDAGTWRGVPLYVLVGLVDDDDEFTFNSELAEMGYSIRVTDSQPDSYSTNFDSAVIANNPSIIVANTLDGNPLPETIGEKAKPCAPLQMKGVSSGQMIGNIGTIELLDVPSGDGGLLLLSGKMERYLTEDDYEGSSHHFVPFDSYLGMSLYTLVATIDDVEAGVPGKYSNPHFTLNTDIIEKTPYTVLITSASGETYEIDSTELLSGKSDPTKYIIAGKDSDGNDLADGSFVLVGSAVNGVFKQIKSIKLKGEAYQSDDWAVLLVGPAFSVYMTQNEFEETVACAWHATSFAEPYTKDLWSGVTLATLVGYVDDYTLPTDENHGGSFNLPLAENGYKIIVTAADGYSAEVDSKDLVANKNGYIIANKFNGNELTRSENPKENQYPLRLVGSGTYLDAGSAASSKFTSVAVAGVAKIELKDFVPSEQSPTITIEKYGEDGSIIASETVEWFDIIANPAKFPVIGGDNGTQHTFQGLVFEEDGEKIGEGVGWDLEEKYLIGNYKIDNVVKGTAVRDLTDLVGGMGPNDEIKFVCTLDGWTNTLDYSSIYEPHPRLGTVFLAWYADGKVIPEYSQGPRLFFTSDDNKFSHADMYESINPLYWHYNSGRASAPGLSAQMVDLIKIVPKPDDWSITLTGAINEKISRGYFESGLTCTFVKGTPIDHQASYTDEQGREWSGMPLWLLVGFVDDENAHTGSSYAVELAEEGYDITVIGADGSETVISSIDADRNSNYIIANTLNGAVISKEDGGPVRLVGTGVDAGHSITQVVEIRLDLDEVF